MPFELVFLLAVFAVAIIGFALLKRPMYESMLAAFIVLAIAVAFVNKSPDSSIFSSSLRETAAANAGSAPAADVSTAPAASETAPAAEATEAAPAAGTTEGTAAAN